MGITLDLRCVRLGEPVWTLGNELADLASHHMFIGFYIVDNFRSPLGVVADLSGSDVPTRDVLTYRILSFYGMSVICDIAGLILLFLVIL